jgi:signal transduction histidine kinase
MATPLIDALRAAQASIRAVVTVEPSETAVARRLAREVGEAIARLERGEPEKDLVSIVCHDLKDPLASIVMGAGFLKKTIAADEGATRRVVEAISRSADRMSQVVSDFHDLAKLQSGLLSFDPRPCDVVSVVHGAIAALQVEARERGLVLAFAAPDEHPIATCDRARLAQVMTKLVGNAVKFTASGGRIDVRVVGEGDRVRISVADSGRGIAPERLSEIFDHGANARRSPRDGPGLGLPIVRGIVDLHRGDIVVDSRPGQGSTFSFTLPTE